MRRLLFLALLCSGCRVELGAREEVASGAATVRVYTSMYKEVIDAIEPVLAQKLGETTTVEWFQSGSEKVASRLDAELASGGSACDLLLTSDPAYYARLKSEGKLVPYVSPLALRQPRALVDPDGAWATARISTMVIGRSSKSAVKVKSYRDLLDPKVRATMGDPLSSGTYFTSVSALSRKLGWELFEGLKKKGSVAAGGNASVITRLENGEADAGLVLLENLLTVRERGSTLEIVIPEEGAIPVPGPIALMTHARASMPARAVYDALLSPEIQRIIAEKGKMHSPDPAVAPPAGAPGLEAILSHALPPSEEDSAAIKQRFDRIFFK